MLTDDELFAWFRQKPYGHITQKDIDLAGDVLYVQPILYFLCKAINAKKIIEIGVADGSTTLPLLKAAYETRGTVYSIDPSPCEDAKRLVSIFEYDNNWKFIQTKSDDFFSTYMDDIHFAYIDGDHSWVQVKKDSDNCFSRLAEGGIVIFHDVDYVPKNCVYNNDNCPKQGNYDDECVHGVIKALQLILPKYSDIDFLPIHLKIYSRDSITSKPAHGGFAIMRKRYNNEESLNPKR